MASTPEQDIAQMLCCPLSTQFMRDPVMTSAGNLYDFEHLLTAYMAQPGTVLVDPLSRETCTRFLTIPWSVRSLLQKLCPEVPLASRVAGEMIDMHKQFPDGHKRCRCLVQRDGGDDTVPPPPPPPPPQEQTPGTSAAVNLQPAYTTSLALRSLTHEIQREKRLQDDCEAFEAQNERKRRRTLESQGRLRFVEEVEGKSNGARFSLGNDVIIERESQAVWRFARGEEGRIVGIVVRKSERKLAAARDILVLVRLRDVRYMDLVKKCNGLTEWPSWAESAHRASVVPCGINGLTVVG